MTTTSTNYIFFELLDISLSEVTQVSTFGSPRRCGGQGDILSGRSVGFSVLSIPHCTLCHADCLSLIVICTALHLCTPLIHFMLMFVSSFTNISVLMVRMHFF